MLEALGGRIIAVYIGICRLFYIPSHALFGIFSLRGEKFRYFVKLTIQQIYLTFIQVLLLAIFIGISLGILVIVPLTAIGINDVAIISTIIDKVILYELSPVLTAFIVIGRSGTAITIELSDLKQRQTIDSLFLIGIDPLHFLVLPRIVGVTISILLICVWMNSGVLLGLCSLSLFTTSIDYMGILQASTSMVNLADMGVISIMLICFGLCISSIHCYYGLISHTPIEAARNVPKSFVKSFLVVISITVLFSVARNA